MPTLDEDRWFRAYALADSLHRGGHAPGEGEYMRWVREAYASILESEELARRSLPPPEGLP